MTLDEALTRIADLEARIQALEETARKLELQSDDFPEDLTGGAGGAWNGEIRVAGKIVTSDYLASVTGTASNYVRIWSDGTTAPSYATAIQYAASDWGDDNVIVTVEALYACHGAYNLDRM